MFSQLNVIEQCKKYRVSLWSCPHFLFLVLGFVIITSMIATNITAQRYAEPEIAALIVLAVTALLFTISHIIVKSFESIAEASQAKSEFVSIVSHQLRSPLTAIRWQMELLLKSEKEPKAKEYLETINENNNRMIKLVNDLLEVNRIDNNLLVLQPKNFSLVEITEREVANYNLFAQASNVSVSFKPDTSLPTVFADEMRIRWVIENLIDNAIRYSKPRTAISIAITSSLKGRFLLWSITNHGVDISRQDERRLFQKFFRAESSVKFRTEGSGLGLFVAKSVVEASGGNIGFRREQDGSTTFWFTLPIIK